MNSQHKQIASNDCAYLSAEDSFVAENSTHSLLFPILFFLWDQVFASQIKVKEEIY